MPNDESTRSVVSVEKGQSRGSYVVPVHKSRNVKIYPLLESELDRIGDLNTHATFCFSVASLLLGLASACGWDLANAQQPPTTSAKAIVMVLTVFGFIALSYGIFCACKRRSELERIKTELEARD